MAIKDEILCLLIALIKITFQMQLIDKFTDWNESHKSDILRCRNPTCHSQRTAMLHLTSQLISTDNYSSAENWHIQVKSEPGSEEHPQQALEEEMALRVTALPFESLISLHHTYKNIIHKMKSCSAAIPRNVGILPTQSSQTSAGVVSRHFPIQLCHNIQLLSHD